MFRRKASNTNYEWCPGNSSSFKKFEIKRRFYKANRKIIRWELSTERNHGGNGEREYIAEGRMWRVSWWIKHWKVN